jgi:hypothetical protein
VLLRSVPVDHLIYACSVSGDRFIVTEPLGQMSAMIGVSSVFFLCYNISLGCLLDNSMASYIYVTLESSFNVSNTVIQIFW